MLSLVIGLLLFLNSNSFQDRVRQRVIAEAFERGTASLFPAHSRSDVLVSARPDVKLPLLIELGAHERERFERRTRYHRPRRRSLRQVENVLALLP